ncbi:MAG: TonB-dependent receptor [Alloprevotella sp.]|nr:TonB-dependent receptor [Alloprevotella sp.]
MKKVTLLMTALCLSVPASWAQVQDSLRVEDDNADFTFTESQLDEDNDASQTVSSVTSAKADPYLSEVGYRWSGMRFRVRAYENQYSQTYMNGLMLNDLERGSFSYGMIGGMNDATRNREGVDGYEYNTFALQGIGGATQLNTRASQFAQGSKLAVSGTNRNYVLRGMFTHATGILPSGWSFAGSVGYRWAKEGVIEGTFYNAFSYFLAAEKRLGGGHSLGLVTFGTPTERGQQGASTEEVYWLANSHYYNPNWGYQNGKKRNSRVVNSFEPTAILTWDWKVDDRQKLTTSAGFRYSNYSSTALGWNGDAYDPRPDYYKNLPSSVFDVYDAEKNNPEYLAQNPFLLDQYNTLIDFWGASKANRQVNWDRMYYVNQQNALYGNGEALYYQERRHNDQMVLALSSTYNFNIDTHNKLTAGLQLNHTKGMHYKTMADLLGGTLYTDVDKFAANDYGIGSSEAQNDLRNPNRQIGKDDKFGYDYNIFVNKANLWGQYAYTRSHYTIAAGAHVEGTTIERDGLMQNGRAPENSYGKSGAAKFLGGGGKFQFTYRPTGYHRIMLSAHYDAAAPLARNAFVAPRMQNNFVDRLKLENIYGAELAYAFRIGELTGRISGYYNRFTNGVEQTAFYNDQEERFTYLTMSNVEREHYGFEGALVYQVNSQLSFNILANISDAKYVNNPYAQVNYEGMNASTIASLNQWVNPVSNKAMPLRVLADGMRVNGTPLTALSLGVNYNVNGWFFEANLNYYDRVYVDFSEYRRLSNVVENLVGTVNENGQYVFESTEQEVKQNGGVLFAPDGSILRTYSAKQEKFDGGFMLDLSIGRYLRLKKGKSLSINLSVNNVTNNRNMRTGGYEQNRDDFYNTGVARSYVFSRNAKYYYANALNAFLNISFKF